MRNKAILSLLTIFLLIGACKARKVTITHTDSTVVSHITQTKDSVSVDKDTTSSKTNQLVVSSDSGSVTTTFTPATGKVLIDSFGYIKNAGKIIRVHKYTKHQQANTNTVNQARGNDSTNVKQIAVKNDSTNVKKSVKGTLSTPNNKLVFYIAGGLILLLIGCIIVWEVFKPKI
jgi:hypothetical protein